MLCIVQNIFKLDQKLLRTTCSKILQVSVIVHKKLLILKRKDSLIEQLQYMQTDDSSEVGTLT